MSRKNNRRDKDKVPDNHNNEGGLERRLDNFKGMTYRHSNDMHMEKGINSNCLKGLMHKNSQSGNMHLEKGINSKCINNHMMNNNKTNNNKQGCTYHNQNNTMICTSDARLKFRSENLTGFLYKKSQSGDKHMEKGSNSKSINNHMMNINIKNNNQQGSTQLNQNSAMMCAMPLMLA